MLLQHHEWNVTDIVHKYNAGHEKLLVDTHIKASSRVQVQPPPELPNARGMCKCHVCIRSGFLLNLMWGFGRVGGFSLTDQDVTASLVIVHISRSVFLHRSPSP